MLNSLLAAVTSGLGHQSFEDYYSALVINDPEVAPKAREARQDYLPKVKALADLHAVMM